MTEQNEFQDQDLNQTQNKTNVEQKIDHEDSEDDLSISTDEILHTAMYHQHYQSTENQRLENEVSLLREHIKVYVYEQIHNSNFDNNQVGQLDTESVQSVEHKCYADDLENDMETESKISDNDSSSGDSDMLERIMMRNLSLFESKSNENNNSDNQSSCNDSSVANNGNNIIPMANPYNTYDHGCNTENILPSFVQFIPHEYAKVDTMFSNIGDVYYHNNVLPEIMQQSEMLMQLLQDQQIFMKIFADAWNCYFVICVYSISNSAFNNFYLLLYGSKCLCQFMNKNDL